MSVQSSQCILDDGSGPALHCNYLWAHDMSRPGFRYIFHDPRLQGQLLETICPASLAGRDCVNADCDLQKLYFVSRIISCGLCSMLALTNASSWYYRFQDAPATGLLIPGDAAMLNPARDYLIQDISSAVRESFQSGFERSRHVFSFTKTSTKERSEPSIWQGSQHSFCLVIKTIMAFQPVHIKRYC